MSNRWLLRVAVALAVIELALSFWLYSPCGSAVWGTGDAVNRWCYNDISLLFGHRGGTYPDLPYRDYMLEYPAGTAVFVALAAVATAAWQHFTGATDATVTYHTITLLAMASLALFVVVAVHHLADSRYAALFLVLTPSFAVAAFFNWDLLAVACMIGALWCWQRRNPALAGIFIGLGASAKLFPVLLLWPLLLLGWRSRNLRPFGAVAGWAAAAWTAVNLPFVLSPDFREGWLLFYRFSADRRFDLGTLWHLVGYQPSGAILALFLVGCFLAIGWVAFQASNIPRLAPLAFLAVSAFLLTSKVWSVQYVWWVLPLAILAGPGWRAIMVWQLAELLYYADIWSTFGNDAETISFTLIASLRWITLFGLCLICTRQVLTKQSELPSVRV